MSGTQIKLLSSELIAENPQIIKDIELLSKGLFKEIGWHYPVDLVWVVKTLRETGIQPGATVLDAGAGSGLLQLLLAMYGYNVISVDFSPRRMNLFTRHLFKFDQISNREDFTSTYISHVKEVGNAQQKMKKLWHSFKSGQVNLLAFPTIELKLAASKIKLGRITFYQADMTNMKEVASESADAVVSVSAIEHMEKEAIKGAIREFTRVLKIGAPMILTTSASKNDDWFHQPSKGWCFSLHTLAELLGDSRASKGSFGDFDETLKGYRENTYLKNHLASNYFVSDKNGMPRGVWDPKYIPVGIVKINSSH